MFTGFMFPQYKEGYVFSPGSVSLKKVLCSPRPNSRQKVTGDWRLASILVISEVLNNRKRRSETEMKRNICRNTNFGQLWFYTIYFLGDFNETFRFFHAHLSDVPGFVEKHPMIKYAIFDRPHNLGMDLCETSLKLLKGSY
jgi:hypothetical protein